MQRGNQMIIERIHIQRRQLGTLCTCLVADLKGECLLMQSSLEYFVQSLTFSWSSVARSASFCMPAAASRSRNGINAMEALLASCSAMRVMSA